MDAKQLERASYMAAHAILAANTSAPHLATPGARRTYTVDIIAEKIRSVFELHCSALDDAGAVFLSTRRGSAVKIAAGGAGTTLTRL